MLPTYQSLSIEGGQTARSTVRLDVLGKNCPIVIKMAQELQNKLALQFLRQHD